jgi:hypothetical protein
VSQYFWAAFWAVCYAIVATIFNVIGGIMMAASMLWGEISYSWRQFKRERRAEAATKRRCYRCGKQWHGCIICKQAEKDKWSKI